MHTVHPSHVGGKICSKCKTFKPAAGFSARADQPGKLTSWCLACIAQRSLDRYYADYEENKRYNREWMAAKYRSDPVAARKKAAKWRADHPEQHKKSSRRQEAKRRDKKKTYRVANSEHIKARNTEYRHRKAAEITAYNASYYRENKEAVAARIKKCQAANPDLYMALHKAAKHRRKVQEVSNGPVEKFGDLEIFERDKWICQLCGKKVDKSLKYPHPEYPTLDHVIPVVKGGGHTRANSQLAHLRCNSSKRDRPTTLF